MRQDLDTPPGDQDRIRATKMSRVTFFLVLIAGLNSSGGAVTARQQSLPAQAATSRLDFSNKQLSAIRYLKASNPREDDHLGAGDTLVGVTLALSKDGNTLAVSAPYEDSAATGINGNQRDESAFDAGVVYIY